MTTVGMTTAALAALTLAGAANATEVEIRDAVARVVVIPEARSDVAVQISGGGALPAIRQERTGSGKVVLDGGLKRKIRGCGWYGGSGGGAVNPATPPDNLKVEVDGKGKVKLAEAPLVILRVPSDVRLSASGAVFGSIARSESVELTAAGCGDWLLANTADRLELSVAGSGDVRAGTSKTMKVSIAGSGDVLAVSTGRTEAAIAGSGDIRIGRVDGDVEASVAGSGDVWIGGGRVGRLDASIAGSGDVVVEGPVEALDASIVGSGDVRVASAGSIRKSVMGSGSVEIGR